MNSILCVWEPLRIHPAWERWVAGGPIDETDFSALPEWRKALLWKSYGHRYRANPRDAGHIPCFTGSQSVPLKVFPIWKPRS